MKTNVLTLIITLVVGIILTGALLAPIIQDQTNGEEVVKDNGTAYVKYDSGPHVVDCNLGTVTIDGEPAINTLRFYLISEAFSLWRSGSTLFIEAETTVSIAAYHYTITINDGSAVINDGTSDVATYSCPGIWIPTTEVSEYVLNNSAPYVDSINDVSFSLLTRNPDTYYFVTDGKVFKNGVLSDTCTYQASLTEVEGLDDVYQLGNGTIDDNGNSVATNGSVYIVPKTVEGIVSGSDEGQVVTLLAVIPVLVIVALLIYAVRAVSYKD